MTTASYIYHRSWAEGDLIVAVAVARIGLTVVGLVVRVGAAGVPAAQRHATAAAEIHGHVVAVDHRDVVVVVGAAAADGELGQRRRRPAREAAGERAAAIAGLAAPAAAVEGAARAAPHPAGACAGGHAECPRLVRVEPHAAAHGDGRRPHGVAASVGDSEGGRVGAGHYDHGEDDEQG